MLDHNPMNYNIINKFQRLFPQIAKRARQGKKVGITLAITAITSYTLYAQGSGTPNQLRVKTDANGYLLVAGSAQTNPVTQTVFSQTRLKTDSNGYLLVVVTGGTITNPILAPTESSCATVAYAFIGRTTTGLNSHASNTWNLCGGGTLGLSGNTTGVTASLPILHTDGTLSAPSFTFTNDNTIGMYRGTDTLLSFAARTRFTGSTMHLGESTYNNGQTGLAGVNSLLGQDFVRMYANNWGSDNGFVIEARTLTTTSPANPGLELQSRVYNASTWAAIQFDAFKATGSGGTYALNALADNDLFIAYCNNAGSSPCDNKVYSLLGNGQTTSFINSVASSAIGASSVYGYSLTNSIPATSGAQAQWSPAFQMCGTAWKTDATTGSQVDCFRVITKPIAAAGATTATLAFQSSINDGVSSYTDRASLTSAGLFTASTINATSAYQTNGTPGATHSACSTSVTAITVTNGLVTAITCT